MVTERDKFVKPIGKVFHPEKSKVLILGTMPLGSRLWYYQENQTFWEIMSEALDLPELSKLSTTDRRKKELLITNGIALWDIFECGWRKDGKTSDESIIFQKAYKPTPSKIYEDIISKGKIDFIIINGLQQALEWFIEYNQEEEIKQMIAAGKVISLHQTKWIESSPVDASKYKVKWIQTIKKALGKHVEPTSKPKPTTTTSLHSTHKTVEKPKTVEKYNGKTTKKAEEKKPQKIAFVVKKHREV